MKRLFDFLNTYQSLYFVTTSLLGFAFVLLLYVWTFPVRGDEVGIKFTNEVSYAVWVLEFCILSAFLTVVIFPLWKTFGALFREQSGGQEFTYKSRLRFIVVSGTLAFVISWLFFITLVTLSSAATDASWPQYLNERLYAIYSYIFITLLPIPLTNLLIYEGVGKKIIEIGLMDNDEKKLFALAHSLLKYRDLLQNGLLIMGIIASAVPITAATLRLIVVALDKTNETTFPLIGVIAYGLGFSAILILFYVPTHLILTQAAHTLKDKLCPVNNFSELTKNLKRSKDLDEWLCINISLTDNLKTGILTLAPLFTSFLATILGINI